MADTKANFQQNLISQSQINHASPNWTRQMQEDYFRFKSDLVRTSDAGDGLINRIEEIEAELVVISAEIDTLQLQVTVLEVVTANNSFRLDVLEPRVSQNEADIISITQNYSYAAYGSLLQEAQVALPDIAVGVWENIPLTQEAIATPKGVTQSTINGSLAFAKAGIYSNSFKVSLFFTPDPTRRKMYIRFYNLTTATAKPEIYISGAFGDDQGWNDGFTAPLEIEPAEVGDEFVMQVSAAAAVANVFLIGASWYASFASEGA